jgi:hypothetical protein
MTDSDILLRAAYRGGPVTVTHATAEEIEALAGPVSLGDSKLGDDMLELWSLIAIRFEAAVEIHALGWRVLLANTWVSSRVVAANLTEGIVRTRSGKMYLLGVRDKPDLDPELRAHLAYALKTWKFIDVQQS